MTISKQQLANYALLELISERTRGAKTLGEALLIIEELRRELKKCILNDAERSIYRSKPQ